MDRSLDSYSSIKDVTYSCGYCGYALNLSSTARDTAGIGSKYRKNIRKGVVRFLAVDEGRFTLADEVVCMPHVRANGSWGLFRRRSRLLCRKCGGRVGDAYGDEDAGAGAGAWDGGSGDLRASSGGSGASNRKSYVIKITALQPSSDDSALVPFTP
ncbi:hypothetical protein ACP4OV_019645 [Aristida adscensionis]